MPGDARQPLPLVIAGDLFHSWNAPPELINFALRWIGKDVPTYAVPGNHDLPNHRYEDRRRSAYWTLACAGAVQTLVPGQPVEVGRDGLILYGYPEGYDPAPLLEPEPDKTHLAVVHRYLWQDGMGYPGADQEHHVLSTVKLLRGYSAAVFGDNHQPFRGAGMNGTGDLLNCGTFIRRRSDERDLHPGVGVLYDDGSIEVVLTPCAEDEWVSLPELVQAIQGTGLDAEELVELLRDLGDQVPRFRDAVQAYLRSNPVGPMVEEMIRRWVEGQTEGEK